MKKKLPIILLGLLIFSGGIYYYLKFKKLDDFNPIIKEKLQTLVHEGSAGLYRLEFDSLQADVINSTLVLSNVRLIPDTVLAAKLDSAGKRPADIFNISIASIAIDGININDFSSGKQVDLNSININGPSLEIFHKNNKAINFEKDTASIQTLYQRISTHLNRLSVKRLSINNMYVFHHTFINSKKEKQSIFNKVNIQFDKILVDSLTQYDSTRFLYAENANISVGKLKFPTADSLYYLGVDSVSINALQKDLTAYSFTVMPRGDKNTFTKKLLYVKERYNITFKEVFFKKIDWWSIVSNEGFSAKEASVKNGNLAVYKDRNLPPFPGSKVGRYPQQLLMKIPFPIAIDKLKVSNLDVTYEEINPNSEMLGKIMFTNINGTATNVTNDSNKIAVDPFMKIEANCMALNDGPLHVIFGFDLSRAKQGVFTVNAEFGAMNVDRLNKVFEPLGLFKIKEGKINGLTLSMKANNQSSTGTVKFLYKDLKIDIYKKGNEDGEQKKRGLISFIANTFVLQKSNPGKDGITRVENVTTTRDIHKSFFNVILKTMLQGIFKTAGK